MAAESPLVLMPREFRTASEFSQPFYTTAQKVVFGVTTEAGTADVTFGVQMWSQAESEWREFWTAALAVAWSSAEPVTRYTFHNHTFGLTTYDVYNVFVQKYLPRNAPLRLFMELSGSGGLAYSVLAADCVSLIEAVV